jgi:hypothetical protein
LAGWVIQYGEHLQPNASHRAFGRVAEQPVLAPDNERPDRKSFSEIFLSAQVFATCD